MDDSFAEFLPEMVQHIQNGGIAKIEHRLPLWKLLGARSPEALVKAVRKKYNVSASIK